MKKRAAKHLGIENDILQKIQSGELKTGDQIMTEKELCEVYGVSRMTVNKALQSLSTKGYIKRTAGKGTFVHDSNIKKVFGLSNSFTDDILSIGQKPGAILNEYRIYRGEEIPDIARRLNVDSKSFIHYFSRIRTADDIKIALSYTYIKCDTVPALDITTLENSFYQFIKDELNIHPRVTNYAVSATLPTEEQKELLEIDDVALLKVVHPGYLENGEIFEYTQTFYVGSRYTYYFQQNS